MKPFGIRAAIGSLAAMFATFSIAAPIQAASPTVYTPQFTSVATELGHYWIEDHGQRIALFGPVKKGLNRGYQIGLFRQFPGQSLDEKTIKDAEILDFVSLPGLRLDTNWIGAPAMRGVPGQMKLDSSDPRQLVIRLSWKKSAEELGTQVLRVTYDPQMVRYVVRVQEDLQLKQPGGGEYCNFYANGLGDFRPWVSRYKQLLYQDADEGGKLKAHYLSLQVPQPGPIHLPAANGLVGYANEKDGNPVVIVEESTPRTMDNICLCWFDSHLTWDESFALHGRGKERTKDFVAAVPGPPYRYHAKLKAYWNSPAETAALLAKAQRVSLAPFADRFADIVPLEMNVVNDFDRTADFLSGDVKHIHFRLQSEKRNGSIEYDDTVSRSGHRSIRLVSKTDKGIQQSLGPELMVTPGRQVKISAWVKTRDVDGEGFCLESSFQRWTPAGNEPIGPVYRSPSLGSNNDWTLLEVPMPVTPPKAEFLGKGRITFRLSGTGTAWMDDFVFAEQDAGVPPVSVPAAQAKP